jgi:hypothetical protein
LKISNLRVKLDQTHCSEQDMDERRSIMYKTDYSVSEAYTLIYRMSTKEFYTLKMIQKTNVAYLEPHNHASR